LQTGHNDNDDDVVVVVIDGDDDEKNDFNVLHDDGELRFRLFILISFFLKLTRKHALKMHHRHYSRITNGIWTYHNHFN